jgi:hypothetical protein
VDPVTALPDLVRRELQDLADSHPPPAGLADRSIRAGQRRRRRAFVAVAAACVLGVALPLAVAAVRPSGPAGVLDTVTTGDARNVVYAVHRGAWDNAGQAPWQVLDPTSGGYRELAAGQVTEPSSDLRYTVIHPPWVYEPGKMPEPATRVGRYESATGQTRWYDIGRGIAEPRISPDGRRAVMGEGIGVPGRLVLLDLDTGATESVTLEPAAAAAIRGSYATSDIRWHPDSRHLVVARHIVVDLRGRVTKTLPVPAGATAVALRPAGNGLLVQPQDGGFALTDDRGRIVARVSLNQTCQPEGEPPAQRTVCRPAYGFATWRGQNGIVVGSGFDQFHGLNLRSGDLRTLHTMPQDPLRVDNVIVASADALPADSRAPTF